MIIVSGRIHVAPERRDEFVAASREAMAEEAFRGDGPGPELAIDVVGAEVRRHHVASSGPA
jgi:hypothetical protein